MAEVAAPGTSHDTSARETGVHLLQLISVSRRTDKAHEPRLADVELATAPLWAPRGFLSPSSHSADGEQHTVSAHISRQAHVCVSASCSTLAPAPSNRKRFKHTLERTTWSAEHAAYSAQQMNSAACYHSSARSVAYSTSALHANRSAKWPNAKARHVRSCPPSVGAAVALSVVC